MPRGLRDPILVRFVAHRTAGMMDVVLNVGVVVVSREPVKGWEGEECSTWLSGYHVVGDCMAVLSKSSIRCPPGRVVSDGATVKRRSAGLVDAEMEVVDVVDDSRRGGADFHVGYGHDVEAPGGAALVGPGVGKAVGRTLKCGGRQYRFTAVACKACPHVLGVTSAPNWAFMSPCENRDQPWQWRGNSSSSICSARCHE